MSVTVLSLCVRGLGDEGSGLKPTPVVTLSESGRFLYTLYGVHVGRV